MQYSKFEKYVSSSRLRKYRSACLSDIKAQELYKLNLNVSKSFYPILSLFETFLRNAINEELTNHFNDPDWILNQKNSGGFMRKKARCYLLAKILEAESKCVRDRQRITAPKIISELPFGFWTAFFKADYYSFVKGSVINCFSNRPKHIQRKMIYNHLYEIRQLRNRIYHNEPICFGKTGIDFSKALQVKKELYELAEWLEPDTVPYMQQFDDIDNQINQWQP